MARPRKYRRVEHLPSLTYFKPAGVPLRDLQEIRLTIEELEAIRLKDLEGLEQEASAMRMAISRPTFQRLLISARAKIAEAFVRGKAIRIEGGKYRVALKRLSCTQCGNKWEVPFAREQRYSITCPQCKKNVPLP